MNTDLGTRAAGTSADDATRSAQLSKGDCNNGGGDDNDNATRFNL